MTSDDHRLRIAVLPRNRPARFSLIPDPGALKTLARRLGLDDLRKLRFEGELGPEGAGDWRLAARLGATVVQPCIVTLAPVTTRIEEPVTRIYRAEGVPVPEAEEAEMTADETEEALGEVIDLDALLEEALALALPPYPRAEGATLDEAAFAAPGVTPMRDEDAHPFAALAALRDKDGDGEEDEGDDGDPGGT